MSDYFYFTSAVFFVVAVFLIFALAKSISLRLKKPKIGTITGKEATASEEIDENKTGFVVVEGEIWKASSKHKISKGEKVKITGKEEDYTLIVEPVNLNLNS